MQSTRLSFTTELKQSKMDLTTFVPDNIKAAARRESIYGKLTLANPALAELKKTEDSLGTSLLSLADVLETYQADMRAFLPTGFNLQDSIALHRNMGQLNKQLALALPRHLANNTIDNLYQLFTTKQFAELINFYRQATRDYNSLRTVVSDFISSKTYKEKTGESRIDLSQEALNTLEQAVIKPIQRSPRYLLLVDQIIKQTRHVELYPQSVMKLQALMQALHRTTHHINQYASSEVSDELFTALIHDELNLASPAFTALEQQEIVEKANFFFHHLDQLQEMELTMEARDVRAITEKLQTEKVSGIELNRMASRLNDISARYKLTFLALISREITQREEEKQTKSVRIQTAEGKQLEDKKLGVLQHFKYFAEQRPALDGRETVTRWVRAYASLYGENPLQILNKQRRQGLMGLFNPAQPHFFALFANHFGDDAFTQLQAESPNQSQAAIGKIYQSHLKNQLD